MTKQKQVSAAAAATTRRPWNTSTRLTENNRTRATGTESVGNHEDRGRGDDGDDATRDADTKSHSRCTSPNCQSRQRVTLTTTPPATSRYDGRSHGAQGKRRQQSPERVGPHKTTDVSSPDNPTRAMIERAFDAAFTSTLQDPGLTALSASVEFSDAATSTARPHREPLRAALDQADDAAKQWRAHYVRRREQRQRAAEELSARDAKAAEFQRAMLSARVEYEQRKLAIQSLQARLQLEMRFLEATASELSHRESLLDEAFEGYQQWLRGELDGDTSGGNARAG